METQILCHVGSYECDETWKLIPYVLILYGTPKPEYSGFKNWTKVLLNVKAGESGIYYRVMCDRSFAGNPADLVALTFGAPHAQNFEEVRPELFATVWATPLGHIAFQQGLIANGGYWVLLLKGAQSTQKLIINCSDGKIHERTLIQNSEW